MSIFSPNPWLNRRKDAETLHVPRKGLARALHAIPCLRVAASFYPTCRTTLHFRTPSPCGQLGFSKLSTFSLSHNLLIQRGFASLPTGRELPLHPISHMSFAEAVIHPEKGGTEQWTSKHGRWPLRPAARSPLVEIQWQNKRLSAQARGRRQPWFWTESRSRVPSSARRATFFIARPTRQNATNAASYWAFLRYPQAFSYSLCLTSHQQGADQHVSAPTNNTPKACPDTIRRGLFGFSPLQTARTSACSKRS